MAKRTATKSFGTSKREAHDASRFYSRPLYAPAGWTAEPNDAQAGGDTVPDVVKRQSLPPGPAGQMPGEDHEAAGTEPQGSRHTPLGPANRWHELLLLPILGKHAYPRRVSGPGVHVAAEYNVGKDYDDELTLDQYFSLIRRVTREVYRVLLPGGRYVINLANLGRKPYIPLHTYFFQLHMQVGFLPMGEIIWLRGKGANGSCAWGSWRSASSPRLRDLHEYLLVFAKEGYERRDKGVSDISPEEFMQATLSLWEIAPNRRARWAPCAFPGCARRTRHQAVFLRGRRRA